MKSVEFKSHVGPDGKLKLEIPLSISNADLEVIVIVQPLIPNPATYPGCENAGRVGAAIGVF